MNILSCDTLNLPLPDSPQIQVLQDFRETDNGYIAININYYGYYGRGNPEAVLWVLDDSFHVKREIIFTDTLQKYIILPKRIYNAYNFYGNNIVFPFITLDAEDSTHYVIYFRAYTDGKIHPVIKVPYRNSNFFNPHSNWGSRILMIKPLRPRTIRNAVEFLFLNDSFRIVDTSLNGGAVLKIDREHYLLNPLPRTYRITSTGDLICVFSIGQPDTQAGISWHIATLISLIPKEVLEKRVHTNDLYTNQGSIKLYPNPATGDRVYITGPDKQVRTVLCTDLKGSLWILQVERNAVDISFLSDGIYYLQFFDRNNQLLGSGTLLRWSSTVPSWATVCTYRV